MEKVPNGQKWHPVPRGEVRPGLGRVCRSAGSVRGGQPGCEYSHAVRRRAASGRIPDGGGCAARVRLSATMGPPRKVGRGPGASASTGKGQPRTLSRGRVG
ncbi:hypothetical protein Sdia_27380 [Streptomyces diastaticus subsp. diastaticus]|uniref:Uncharacterized protein n=1 Tax=Streptomyces diastaticus subsp. diastaticus TaxID=68040 RepID=A0ABQ1CNU9_STRDI|nr:hypothetical protein Srut_31970 [Streptomyces rutgersensis]GFH71970.1 hypothetical protein Sdia_27380 [Streptomyces diastaticus subsp. diastaticus]GGU30887.1 hypothetical protein GCM10015534_36960 [Streptomyces diastaticus subsp. diastaticus]